jgi:hypothetical protein
MSVTASDTPYLNTTLFQAFHTPFDRLYSSALSDIFAALCFSHPDMESEKASLLQSHPE